MPPLTFPFEPFYEIVICLHLEPLLPNCSGLWHPCQEHTELGLGLASTFRSPGAEGCWQESFRLSWGCLSREDQWHWRRALSSTWRGPNLHPQVTPASFSHPHQEAHGLVVLSPSLRPANIFVIFLPLQFTCFWFQFFYTIFLRCKILQVERWHVHTMLLLPRPHTLAPSAN